MLQFLFTLFLIFGFMVAPDAALAASRGDASRIVSKPLPVSNYGNFKKLTISQNLGANQPYLKVTKFFFSGNEGDYGTFDVKLKEKPFSSVNVSVSGSSPFFTPDTDGRFGNGFTNVLTFTPANWDKYQTVKFVSEIDNSGASRNEEKVLFKLNFVGTNLKAQTLNYGFPLGVILNTNTPDPSHFNIDLDFRQVAEDKYWTKARINQVQAYVSNSATHLTASNELPDINVSTPSGFGDTDAGLPLTAKGLKASRYFDDVGIFIRPYDEVNFSSSSAFTNNQYNVYGGFSSASPKVRVSTTTMSHLDKTNGVVVPSYDYAIISRVLHEVGHSLGLVGQNWTSYNLINFSVTPNQFTGSNTKALLGTNLILDVTQTGSGTTSYHPEADATKTPPHYHSIMSYLHTGNASNGGIYDICFNTSTCDYTTLDLNLLRDAGWVVQ